MGKKGTYADDLLVHLLEMAMYLRSVDRKTSERLGLVAGLDNRSIRETLCLGDEVDLQVSVSLGERKRTYDIHSETVSALCEPPVHHVINSLSEFGVLPVQVWLSVGVDRNKTETDQAAP